MDQRIRDFCNKKIDKPQDDTFFPSKQMWNLQAEPIPKEETHTSLVENTYSRFTSETLALSHSQGPSYCLTT